MLDGIRKKRNSLLILLIFAAIIIVFIFWGAGPTGNGGNAVAIVDGEQITVKDYLNTYKSEYEYFKNTFKGEFNEEVATKMNLKQRALDILINRALVVQAARDKRVRVTKEEIQGMIMAMPAFQKSGVFDKETYFNVLAANKIKPADFEEGVRVDLLANKMRETVISGIEVNDEELRNTYQLENKKVDFSYIAVSSDIYRDKVEVTDDEARTYLGINSEEFMVPAKVDVFYAYVDYKELADKVKVSEDDIKKYFEENPAQFETSPEVKARHILVRPESREAADREAARKEAVKLLDMLNSGADFGELARKNSDDPGTAAKGGDLGWFPRGVMIKEFEDAAFSLNPGEMSGVVETGFGFHIIKVEDKKEAGLKSLNAVKGDIRKILSRRKAQDEAEEVLKALDGDFRAAETVKELKKAASAKGVHHKSTGLITEGDKTVKVMKDQRLEDTIFTMRPGEVSRPVESNEKLYIIKLRERLPAHVPKFEEIAGKVKERVRERKASEEALSKARDILKKAVEGEDFKELAGADGLKVQSTGFFSRAEAFMPKVGVFVANRPDLFEITASEPYFREVLSTNGSHFVLKLDRTKDADPEGLEEVREELSTRLLAEKQEEAVVKWVDDLRRKADIKYYPEKM